MISGCFFGRISWSLNQLKLYYLLNRSLSVLLILSCIAGTTIGALAYYRHTCHFIQLI
jgi:hypothetical protein